MNDTPQTLYVELTTRCNLDCLMCIRHSWDQPPATMPAATFAALLDQLREFATPVSINFSGYGEPLTHPRFWEFLAQTKQAGHRAEMITNGLLLDPPAAERLLDLGLDKLIVSVDAMSGGSGRLLHGDTFGAVSSHLRALQQLRLARGVNHPEVWLECVATRRNIGELLTLKGLARVLGFTGILVTNLIPHTPELMDEILYERWNTAAGHRGPSVWNPVVDVPLMDAFSPASAVVDRLRDGGTLLRVAGAPVSGHAPVCPFITQGRLAVLPDGNVSPCLPLMHTHTYYFRRQAKRHFACHFGNVNAVPLRAIWESEPYRQFRDRVRRWEFSPCLSCGSCGLRATNREDCTADTFPRCGECLWAAGLVQCP